MKALRRSLKGEKLEGRGHVHHPSLSTKDAVAILPPKKVIRALYDYQANPHHVHELTFSKGDFFHVIGRENDRDWYEACNPSMPNARGLVPVQFFQVLGRTERDSAGSTLSRTSTRFADNDSAEGDRGEVNSNGHPHQQQQQQHQQQQQQLQQQQQQQQQHHHYQHRPDQPQHQHSHPPSATSNVARASMGAAGRASGAMVYGIVMYDFAAERPDELEAKSGEAIIVIAQSNPEWFVAKPIGRLGGPGLIPVSFIEIRDMTTGRAVPDPHEAVQRAGVPKVEEWKRMAADYKNSSISLGKFESGRPPPHDDIEGRPPPSHEVNGSASHAPGRASQVGHPPRGWVLATPTETTLVDDSRPTSTTTTPPPLAPVSAVVSRWYFARENYWYVIEAVMEDGRHWKLSRAYQDFYDFQIALLSEFPEEAGRAGKPRTLPYMPGPVHNVTDAISNMRRESLDEYIQHLLTMASYISRGRLIRQLFAPSHGDECVEPDPTLDMTNGRWSGTSGGGGGGGGGPSLSNRSLPVAHGRRPEASLAPTAPPPAPISSSSSSTSQLTTSYGNGVGQHGTHYRGPSDLTRPAITRQVSSLTQTSNGSQVTVATTSAATATTTTTSAATATTTTAGAGSGAMKIKIYFQDDLIAVRVPTDITFDQLREKLQGRLSVGHNIRIQYRDEPNQSYEPLQTDEDLYLALQRNPKLTLYVNH